MRLDEAPVSHPLPPPSQRGVCRRLPDGLVSLRAIARDHHPQPHPLLPLRHQGGPRPRQQERSEGDPARLPPLPPLFPSLARPYSSPSRIQPTPPPTAFSHLFYLTQPCPPPSPFACSLRTSSRLSPSTAPSHPLPIMPPPTGSSHLLLSLIEPYSCLPHSSAFLAPFLLQSCHAHSPSHSAQGAHTTNPVPPAPSL